MAVALKVAAEIAPFYAVDQALRFAYGSEGRVICKTSSVFTELVQRTDRRDAPLTAWEAVAQGVLIRSLCKRVLVGVEMQIVDAYYRPAIGFLYERKRLDCEGIGRVVAASHKCDVWLASDAVRKWAKMRPAHDWRWWAQHLGKGETTIYYLVYGRRLRAQPGIMHTLDGLLGQSIAILDAEMRAENLVG